MVREKKEVVKSILLINNTASHPKDYVSIVNISHCAKNMVL